MAGPPRACSTDSGSCSGRSPTRASPRSGGHVHRGADRAPSPGGYPAAVPRPSSCAALIAVAALVLAGCGADEEGGGGRGPTPDPPVRTAVAKFGIATREKDYQEICDQLLSDELVTKIEGVGLPCEAALQRGLGDVRAPTLEINEVSINGARALVSIHTTAAGQEPSD